MQMIRISALRSRIWYFCMLFIFLISVIFTISILTLHGEKVLQHQTETGSKTESVHQQYESTQRSASRLSSAPDSTAPNYLQNAVSKNHTVELVSTTDEVQETTSANPVQNSDPENSPVELINTPEKVQEPENQTALLERPFVPPFHPTIDAKSITKYRPPLPRLPSQSKILEILNKEKYQNPKNHRHSRKKPVRHFGITTTGLPEPTPLIVNERIVHFDLKGAPPKPEYYRQIFPILKQLGATGLLMEYEDMFPYSGALEVTRARNAYSENDIEVIKNLAAENGLPIIPLIQTFGHLEHVLKHAEFSHLREVPGYPTAVCPSNKGSVELVQELIDQIIQAHPNSTYLHIGADEVFHLGLCPVCSATAKNTQQGKHTLFLSFLAQTLTYIRDNYPHIRPIMWDDMFHLMAPDEIKFGLGELASYVEIMIWSYFQDFSRHLPQNGRQYADVFTNFWGATAFKGSAGEGNQIPDIALHSLIHTSWLESLQRYGNQMKNFRGIVLTGWSRYDHFNPLCELFPTSIPSLAVNLEILREGMLTVNSTARALKTLNCKFQISQPHFSSDDTGSKFRNCDFPGIEIFKLALRARAMNDQLTALFKELEIRLPHYQTSQGYAQPDKVENSLRALKPFEARLKGLINEAIYTFSEVFDQYTLSEWIEEQLGPQFTKLHQWTEVLSALTNRTRWESRPLAISSEVEEALATTSEMPTEKPVPYFGQAEVPVLKTAKQQRFNHQKFKTLAIRSNIQNGVDTSFAMSTEKPVYFYGQESNSQPEAPVPENRPNAAEGTLSSTFNLNQESGPPRGDEPTLVQPQRSNLKQKLVVTGRNIFNPAQPVLSKL